MNLSVRYRRWALVLMLCGPLLQGRAALAQHLPEWRLPRGRQVRLQLADSSVVVGRLVETQSDRVVLRMIVRPGKPFSYFLDRDIAVDSIARAWVHRGTHWRRGALIGAGAGLLAMFVAVAATLDYETHCDASCWLEGAGIGLGAGGLIGAFVGYQFPMWRPARPGP